MVVNGGAHQVQPVTLVYINPDSVYVKMEVEISLLVKSQNVTHARAAAATDAYSKAESFGDIFGLDDLPNLLCGAITQANRNAGRVHYWGSAGHVDTVDVEYRYTAAWLSYPTAVIASWSNDIPVNTVPPP